MLGCYEKSPLAASHFDYISKVIEVMKVHSVKGICYFTYLVQLTQFMKNNLTLHSCHKLQINRKYCLHLFEAKRVQILYISSHIKEGFYIERENFE